MPALALRDYQLACVDAHYSYFDLHDGNPLFVVPTAGGKSLIIAEFLKRVLRDYPETRAVALTHVKELIEQNHDELVSHWGGTLCPAGIYSAGAGRRDAHDQIVFAGIQSVYDKPDLLGAFDIALIDEAHLIPKKGQGRYLTYLQALRELNPKLKVFGYTATPFRLDGGYLHVGEGRIFTHVAYEVSIELLVERGYLAPLVAKRPQHTIDTEGVGTASTGDFNSDELQFAATKGDCVAEAVTETVEIAQREGRKAWLFFATGIQHARMLVDELQARGVSAMAVFGDTDRRERGKVINDFKQGRLTALVNVGVLTTGFNAPRCDLMAVMRPTQSAALYVQMMGRGMRTFPGKVNCLVLDYGLNVERHGPINRVRPKGVKGGGSGAFPVKLCPACQTYVAAGSLTCSHCGHEWPEREIAIEHQRHASVLAPIDFTPEQPDVHAVVGMHCRRHTKIGKPDSLRIDFMVGMMTMSEWCCLEHQGFPREKARKMWRRLGGKSPVPATVAEALDRAGELRQPCAVATLPDADRRHQRIVSYYMDPHDVPAPKPEAEIPF